MRETSWIIAALIVIATSSIVMAEDILELTIQTQWRKLCFNGSETDPKRICATRAESRKMIIRCGLRLISSIGKGRRRKFCVLSFLWACSFPTARG